MKSVDSRRVSPASRQTSREILREVGLPTEAHFDQQQPAFALRGYGGATFACDVSEGWAVQDSNL